MDTRESLILDARGINFCLYDRLNAESLTGSGFRDLRRTGGQSFGSRRSGP